MARDHNIFKIVVTISFFVGLLVGCTKEGSSQSGSSDSPIDQALVSGEPALAMVQRFNMGSNLEQMANQVAMSTNTYGMVADKHGASKASAVVEQEIRKLIPNYQSRWNKNLAQAYASHLSGDELRSLAVDGRKSSYVNRLVAVQNTVGSDMQSTSMPILTELVTEALSNAIK